MHRILHALVVSCLTLLIALPAAAQAPAKKLVRIHTAGPADLGVDNTMMAHQFMTYVNANSDSVEVKVFPNSQLGQSREVIEAMQLGSGASGTTGGPPNTPPSSSASACSACRSCGRATSRSTPCSTARSARSSRDMEKAGFKVLAWADSWGYRNVVTAKKEVKTRPT